MNKTSAIFNISFRPFFLLAGLIAFINPIIWVFNYLGQLSLSLQFVDPLFWHGHEMIFGFSGALIAGFILTASANWTSTQPYQGNYLKLLAGLWILERISYFIPFNIHISFVLMNVFFPVLSIMLLKKLWKFPKQRNVFMPILIGITIAKLVHSFGNIYSHDDLITYGKTISSSLIRFIVILIAGRVVPFFTRKKIAGSEIHVPKWINLGALVSMLILVIPFQEGTPKALLVFIYIFAISFNILRQIVWKPQITLKVPILYILHIGVAFINIGLILEFLSLFNDQWNFTQASIHMLMAGGLGVVGIGIMTRVSLGHTGRVIMADGWTRIIYVLVIIGALLRVIVPVFFPELYMKSLHMASWIWGGGFMIFFVRYFKLLISPRPDGKEY